MMPHDKAPLPRTSGQAGRLLRAMIGKRRNQERKERGIAAHLFTAHDYLGEATLIDESEGGAKLLCRSPHMAGMAKFVLNPHTAEVHRLELVWQAGRAAGFKYCGVSRVRGYVTDPELQHVRSFWASIAGDYTDPRQRGGLAR